MADYATYGEICNQDDGSGASCGVKEKVTWSKLMYSNVVRPRAKFTTWLACLGRLPTKERLARFGVSTDGQCVWCGHIENDQHLFFDCVCTKAIWTHVLR